jgi:hypothetical protein
MQWQVFTQTDGTTLENSLKLSQHTGCQVGVLGFLAATPNEKQLVSDGLSARLVLP